LTHTSSNCRIQIGKLGIENIPFLGRRQAVRHWILIPAFPGSNPGAPAKKVTKVVCINYLTAISNWSKLRYETIHW
jgi:hypothetical protein